MSSSVLIFITTGTASQSRLPVLRGCFESPIFQVLTLPLLEVKQSRQKSSDQHSLIMEALHRGLKLNKRAPIAIISDRMLPNNAAPALIEETILRALQRGGFDILYLSRHMDACQLMAPVESFDFSKPQLSRTLSPQGVEALLFTPSGRDILLGRRTMANDHKLVVSRSLDETLREEIYRSNISALCMSPNLFRYDIQGNATRNLDFLKVNECQPFEMMVPPGKKLSSSSSGSHDNGRGFQLPGGVLFVFVTLVVLIVAWCFYRIWPGNTGLDTSPSSEGIQPQPKRAPYGGGNNPMVANHNGGDTSLWQSEF